MWWLAVLSGSPAFGDVGRAVHDPEDRPQVLLPRQALAAEALAVVVNLRAELQSKAKPLE